MAGVATVTASMAWTHQLWKRVDDVYGCILAHPFIAGLTDGTLPEDRFAFYLAQDAHYLREYARVLSLVAARAPSHAETARFASHASATYRVEVELHDSILAEGQLSDAIRSTPMGPTTVAYTSFLLATAATGTFTDGVAAALPCFWIYQKVGRHLAERGSPDSRYQRWIDTYAHPDFEVSVRGILAVVDELRPSITDRDAERAEQCFVSAARYEWMFWDAAWRKELWPL